MVHILKLEKTCMLKHYITYALFFGIVLWHLALVLGFTSLTMTPRLSPWKWNSLGVYFSGNTRRKPLSAPPWRYLHHMTQSEYTNQRQYNIIIFKLIRTESNCKYFIPETIGHAIHVMVWLTLSFWSRIWREWTRGPVPPCVGLVRHRDRCPAPLSCRQQWRTHPNKVRTQAT